MRSRTKTAPTHYPRLLFHGLRTAQLFSSLIVGAIMFYFLWHLRHDHWRLPWTFILLLSVALFTILVLSITIVLHCCFGLNPRFNLFLNGGLSIPWAVGFALLAWWSSGTLLHVCNTANWHDDIGIMVCRIYKALFAFTLVGFVSTLCAFILDIVVYRRHTRRGKYNQMQDLSEGKRSVSKYDTRSANPLDNHEQAQPLNAPDSHMHPDPHYATGRYGASEADLGHNNMPQPFQDQPKTGVTGPTEPFRYDTSYHGAHAGRPE